MSDCSKLRGKNKEAVASFFYTSIQIEFLLSQSFINRKTFTYMTVEEVKAIFDNIEKVESSDENAYEKILLQLMKIKRFPVLLYDIPAGTALFRSRTNSEENFFATIDDLSLTPNKFVQSFGRCNRPFQSKFYASENRPTSFMELVEYWSDGKQPGDFVYVTIGRWVLKKDLTTIIITTPDLENQLSEYDKRNGEILAQFIENSDPEIRDATKEIYRFFFEKFRKPSKEDLKNYLITSAITNLSLSLAEGKASAVTYPSVPFGGQGDNFAINRDFIIEDNITLTNAMRNKLAIELNEFEKYTFQESERVSASAIDQLKNEISWQ